jgi:N-acetylmuramoyl-L-alanine amidase
MKALLVSFYLLVAALTASARTPLLGLERITVSGSEYVRLEEWAGKAGMTMKWFKSDGIVSLYGPSGKMNLTVDSRKADIRGVNVWLSLPVVNRNGAALISVVDATSTVDPILFPQKSDAHLTTICLDPGHGGRDTGKAEGRNYEKTYSLLLAREVAALLKQEGLKVCLTRDADSYVELPARTQVARQQGADLFVSLHYNAAEEAVRGLEVYCLAPPGMNSSNEGGGKSAYPREAGNAHDNQNVLLAYEVQKAVTSGVALEDRGMKRSHFEVLREASMPAILVEGGFMSNASDARNIYSAGFRKRMAQAIVNGILAYKRTIEPQQPVQTAQATRSVQTAQTAAVR